VGGFCIKVSRHRVQTTNVKRSVGLVRLLSGREKGETVIGFHEKKMHEGLGYGRGTTPGFLGRGAGRKVKKIFGTDTTFSSRLALDNGACS